MVLALNRAIGGEGDNRVRSYIGLTGAAAVSRNLYPIARKAISSSSCIRLARTHFSQGHTPAGIADTLPFPGRITGPYRSAMKTWMRKRGDRVKIINGKYARHTSTVESNVYQRTADYPDEFANGHQVMLDTGELMTVRWEQVKRLR